MASVNCHVCQTTRDVKETSTGKPRAPRGWKSIDNLFTCAECWAKTYRIAAITVPIASTDWETLRPDLQTAQRAVTMLSNWAVQRLLANDISRAPTDSKLASMPPIYLYGQASTCHAWDDLNKNTAAIVLRAVEQRYRAMRFNLIWRAAVSPPFYHFPQPVPLRSDSYKLTTQSDRIVCEFPLGSRRHRVVLSGGPQFKRQKKAIEWFLSHPKHLAQAALIEHHGSTADHRPINPRHENGNGVRRNKRLLLKIVGWLPLSPEIESTNTLSVRTDGTSLLVVADRNGAQVWSYHADHAKRIVARHLRHLGALTRLSADHKAERRKPLRQAKSYRNLLSEKARKDRQRMTTLCHEVSASVIAYAKRRRTAEIFYDDRIRTFSESFPWAMLRQMIDQKARAAGIRLTVIAAGDPNGLPDTALEH